jgi:hypothetical protein
LAERGTHVRPGIQIASPQFMGALPSSLLRSDAPTGVTRPLRVVSGCPGRRGTHPGMQALVGEVIARGRGTVDPAGLAALIRRSRSADLLGARQTAARSGMLMRSTTPWPAACLTARTTSCGSPQTGGYQRTTTAPNATSAWPSSLLTGPRRRPAGSRAIRSCLSTAKHGLHFFDALVMLTEGRPWMRCGVTHRRTRWKQCWFSAIATAIYVVQEGRGHKDSIQRLSARSLSRLRYQRTSVPDGKSSTRPTSS